MAGNQAFFRPLASTATAEKVKGFRLYLLDKVLSFFVRLLNKVSHNA